MTVCKCDRCGKYVDKEAVPRIQGLSDPLRLVHSKDDIKMDLCPECYMLLRDFLGYNDQTEKEDKNEH